MLPPRSLDLSYRTRRQLHCLHMSLTCVSRAAGAGLPEQLPWVISAPLETDICSGPKGRRSFKPASELL